MLRLWSSGKTPPHAAPGPRLRARADSTCWAHCSIHLASHWFHEFSVHPGRGARVAFLSPNTDLNVVTTPVCSRKASPVQPARPAGGTWCGSSILGLPRDLPETVDAKRAPLCSGLWLPHASTFPGAGAAVAPRSRVSEGGDAGKAGLRETRPSFPRAGSPGPGGWRAPDPFPQPPRALGRPAGVPPPSPGPASWSCPGVVPTVPPSLLALGGDPVDGPSACTWGFASYLLIFL